MIFSSIPFLYYFLPVTVLLYFAVPSRLKNTVLLLASLFFYAWGEIGYVALMVFSITQGYVFGRLIGRFRGKVWSKVFLAASVSVSLCVLGYFKYANFFLETAAGLMGMTAVVLKITLPIGISFYTFQIISYVIDVYRGTVEAQKNYIDMAAYVAMFPQLIAGPIVRYADIEKQLKRRSHSVERAAKGIRRFIFGLAKKVLLANSLGELCDIFRGSTEQSVLFFWMYAVACTLQIYFDFSGYSDMAIGLGRIFGFDFPENFNYPYVSKSITEFWRRWHMSLGTWFRDYVYIPLGGNRVGRLRLLFNILTVWGLTGLWHGAAWNFVVWGLFMAAFLILEKLFLLPYLEKSRVAGHVYTMLLVLISFVIFDAADMKGAGNTVAALFGGGAKGGYPLVSAEALYYLRSYGGIFILSLIGSLPAAKWLVKKTGSTGMGRKLLDVFEPVVLAGLLVLVTAYLVDGSFNPFLYFRF